MNTGLFLILPRPPGSRLTRVVNTAIADAELAESLGFDRVWLTEHHGTDFGSCWSPSVVAAAIAARTTKIGIGYAINVAPFHRARRLAEDLALVDHLSGGRIIAGFGSGYSPVEYQIVGADFDSRSTNTRESVQQVLAHWNDSSSRGVTCFQRPHPPVVIACRSEQAVRSVAADGHGVLLLGGLERIVAGTTAYRDVAGDGGYVGALRHVHVGNASMAEIHEATAWTLSRMNDLTGSDEEPGDHDVAAYLQERASLGACQVQADAAELQAAGVNELLCWMRWGVLTDETVTASMRSCADLLSD